APPPHAASPRPRPRRPTDFCVCSTSRLHSLSRLSVSTSIRGRCGTPHARGTQSSAAHVRRRTGPATPHDPLRLALNRPGHLAHPAVRPAPATARFTRSVRPPSTNPPSESSASGGSATAPAFAAHSDAGRAVGPHTRHSRTALSSSSCSATVSGSWSGRIERKGGSPVRQFDCDRPIGGGAVRDKRNVPLCVPDRGAGSGSLLRWANAVAMDHDRSFRPVPPPSAVRITAGFADSVCSAERRLLGKYRH
ncbi:hypothetical protein GA0115261_110441, partial [Streptomyces sp. OspMP-M43]